MPLLKRPALAVLVLLAASCANFRTLDRGDWVLTYTDSISEMELVKGEPVEVVKPAAGSKREVLPLSRYEEEIAAGHRQRVTVKLKATPPVAGELTAPIELPVGEAFELRVEETEEAQVLIAGDAARPFWTKRSNGESSVFLVGDEPGTTKVKVVPFGKQPVVIEVHVTEP